MLVLPLPIYLVTDSTVQIFGFTWPDNGEAPTFVDKVLFYIRLLRLLKVSRYSTSLRRLGAVLRLKGGELATSVMLGSVVVVFLSVIVYFCELGGEGNLYAVPPAVDWCAADTRCFAAFVCCVCVFVLLGACVCACAGVQPGQPAAERVLGRHHADDCR